MQHIMIEKTNKTTAIVIAVAFLLNITNIPISMAEEPVGATETPTAQEPYIDGSEEYNEYIVDGMNDLERYDYWADAYDTDE